ncbi:hypothetical protein EYR41_004789 [Orbilia oligospora]|uniref:Uncharacterized protein n=1 Tax=Orbilia oligospora TaxID=2813651 RepID=A0A8H2E135_ORBOL|nr:hypothetical protein EYR41_004789 [Orbilia oligospora]
MNIRSANFLQKGSCRVNFRKHHDIETSVADPYKLSKRVVHTYKNRMIIASDRTDLLIPRINSLANSQEAWTKLYVLELVFVGGNTTKSLPSLKFGFGTHRRLREMY